LRVGRQALTTGVAALPLYAHRFSPQKFTSPQLFACLVLKTFLKTDYRGVKGYLHDHSDIRSALALKATPHFTTLQKASRRLTASAVGPSPVPRHRPPLPQTPPGQAVGFRLHLTLAALAGRGPRPDVDRFVPLLDAALANVRIDAALGDAGYDSEANHRCAREQRGVHSFIPASIGRPSANPPAGKYRRRMRQRLDKDYGKYGQRWQAEAGFSMFKRQLGATIYARTYQNQCRELLLRAITTIPCFFTPS
jgi:hypothetical protein